MKKTLYIGLFAFNTFSGVIFNSFAGLGLKAGGSSISTADFLRPGRLAQVGLDAGHPLLDAASQMMGFTSFFANFVQVAVAMVSWLLVLIAFCILAVQLFVTLIEFKLTTLAGFILIPFAVSNKTAFLAEKVLGNVVASGVRVMVLAVIVGIGTGLSRSSPPPMAAASRRSSRRFLSCSPHSPCWPLRPGWLTVCSPARRSLTRALLSEPAVAVAVAVAGTAMAGGASLALEGRAMAAASGAAAAARGGASMAGGVSSPYSLASAGRSSAGRVASGFSGPGRAAASAVAAPVRRPPSKQPGQCRRASPQAPAPVSPTRVAPRLWESLRVARPQEGAASQGASEVCPPGSSA